MSEWIREFTKIVCDKCEEYYLIRDMREEIEAETIILKTGKELIIPKLEARDILECQQCGTIRDYKGEPTLPYTQDNYFKYMGSHGTLKYKKHRRERQKGHLERLRALKNLKKQPNKDFIQEYVEFYLGREEMIMQLMAGINSICNTYNFIFLKYGHPKGRLNVKLLKFSIKELKKDWYE
jgi:hypothetical protein